MPATASAAMPVAAPAMRRLAADGVEIAFLDEGEGAAILLVHGFAATAGVSWGGTGWIEALTRAGHRVVALDQRGHGASSRFHDPAFYKMPLMAEDARRLLDHLGLERVDLMGYSMGARVAAHLAVRHPARIRSLVLGGMGRTLVSGLPGSETVAAALEAPSLEAVQDEEARAFRQFAEHVGGDRRALAACIRARREPIAAGRLGALTCPVLIAIGTGDTVAGPIAETAWFMPRAERFDIPGRDHMRALGDESFKARVIDFLARRP